MSAFSFIRRLGKKTSDGLVGVASGTTPVAALDSPRAYQYIVTVGVVALVASGWLIYHSIVAATAPKTAAVENTNSTNTTALAELTKLKTKDTDGDGISDYDELYLDHTSPYLKDSDGDGIADNVELKSGSDPNCPSGKVCEGFHPLTSIVDANGALTPEFLRKALASAGVPQSTIDKTSDASLLGIYNQVLQSQPNSNTNSSSNTNAASNSNSTGSIINNTNGVGSIAGNTNGATNTSSADTAAALQQIQQLTPAEIRQLLIQNGVDSTTISAVDDATLQQIFLDAVSSSTNSSTSTTP